MRHETLGGVGGLLAFDQEHPRIGAGVEIHEAVEGAGLGKGLPAPTLAARLLVAHPRLRDDLLGAVLQIEAVDEADPLAVAGVVGPSGGGLAVLEVVEVRLRATIGSVRLGLPVGARGGASEGADLSLGGQATSPEAFIELASGFAHLASTDSGEEGDRVRAFGVPREVTPYAGVEVDGEGRARLSVDGADTELVPVLLARWEPLAEEGLKGADGGLVDTVEINGHRRG